MEEKLKMPSLRSYMWATKQACKIINAMIIWEPIELRDKSVERNPQGSIRSAEKKEQEIGI